MQKLKLRKNLCSEHNDKLKEPIGQGKYDKLENEINIRNIIIMLVNFHPAAKLELFFVFSVFNSQNIKFYRCYWKKKKITE